MNFFEAQKRAKQSTFKLIMLFSAAVISIILLTYLVVILSLGYGGESELAFEKVTLFETEVDLFWIIAGAITALISLGTFYKILQLSKGGSYIASSLGGELLANDTQISNHRKILNIVEEMSIASGVPVPPVYILNEPGINAFAAGKSYEDAVIGVTEGAVSQLTRDELQGVIAHEFSHIFNGDMRLNLRIMGVLHGILLIGFIGRSVLRSMGNSKSKKDSDGKAAAFLLGFGLVCIGYIGYFIGEWIKALVSRQREYLADASSVQYTRNPDGIAGALKKIGSVPDGSQIKAPNAQAFSHAFFADGVINFWDKLFATHPPLRERILRIDPAWDGSFFSHLHPKKDQSLEERLAPFSKKGGAISVAMTLASLNYLGNPQDKHIRHAQTLLQSLPLELLDNAHNSLGAQAVVLALLQEKPLDLLKAQERFLHANDTHLFETFTKVQNQIKALDRNTYLPLIEITIAPLKTLSKVQYQKFRTLCEHFINIDNKLSLFEWALQQLVLQSLDIHFKLKQYPKELHRSFRSVSLETDILLSLIAQSQQSQDHAIKALEKINKTHKSIKVNFMPKETLTLAMFSQALLKLQRSKLSIRSELLKASILCIQEDGMITPLETELIHAVASLLRLPLPPLSA